MPPLNIPPFDVATHEFGAIGALCSRPFYLETQRLCWQRCEEITRELLGRWVSELEPVLVFQHGTVYGSIYPIGLTAKGHDKIYVHARWTQEGGNA